MIRITAAKACAAAGVVLITLCGAPVAAIAAPPTSMSASTPPSHSAASPLATANVLGSIAASGGYNADTWGGYVVENTAPGGAVGTMAVPDVSGTANTHMSTWVGMGGWTSPNQTNNTGPLIKAGIEEKVINGTASYTAWTRIYPKEEPVSRTDFKVSAGDKVTVVVNYNAASNQAMFTFTSVGGGTHTYTSTLATAPGKSVEWVNERDTKGIPGLVSSSVTSLPQFSNLTFTQLGYWDTSGAYGPISGTAKPITTTGCDGTTLLSPGPLDAAGTSFTLNRVASGSTEMSPCTQKTIAAKSADRHLVWTRDGETPRDAGGPTDGVIDSAPAVVDMGNNPGQADDIRDAFARGTDGKLYQYRLSGNNAQTGWNNISYGFGGDPSVTRLPDGPQGNNLIAIAETSGDNSGLWFRIFTDDANGISEVTGYNWISVAPPPGGFASSPTIAYSGAAAIDSSGNPGGNRITVTALSTDGAIYTSDTIASAYPMFGFDPWTMVPGSAISYGTPVLAYTGDRYDSDQFTRASNTHLFAMGSNGVLWEDICTRSSTAMATHSCSWGGWNKVGSAGRPAGTALADATAVATPTRTYIAATGNDGSVWFLQSDANSDTFGSDWQQAAPQDVQAVHPAVGTS